MPSRRSTEPDQRLLVQGSTKFAGTPPDGRGVGVPDRLAPHWRFASYRHFLAEHLAFRQEPAVEVEAGGVGLHLRELVGPMRDAEFEVGQAVSQLCLDVLHPRTVRTRPSGSQRA